MLPGLEGYREIPVAEVRPSPFQPRREIADEAVAELAASIRSEGLLQPVVVRKKDSHYELIAGERRWRAFQKLGLKSIPARIIAASDASSATLALIENLQREGLNPIEEALGYASLIRDFELTQEAASERVGKGRATVANALRLLSLEREIQAFLSRGLLTPGHAKVLLGLNEPEERKLLAKRIIEGGLSVRATELEVKRLKEKKPGRPGGPGALNPSEQTVIRDLEKKLTSELKARVVLQHGGRKGKLVIEYLGNDDLQRILERLGLGS